MTGGRGSASASPPSAPRPGADSSDVRLKLVPDITRVRDGDGFVGTVAYVGPVASAKDPNEIYAGVIWDDPTRGKHDGSVISRATNELVRHFRCDTGPNGASFLRLSKLDLGVDLNAKLLRSKYVGRDAPVVAPNNVLPHVARTAGGRDKPIELLGEMKIRDRQQLEDIDEVSLRCLGISGVETVGDGDEDELAEFRHLREIDLAGNLLSEWEVVVAIMRQFPDLENLSLTSNRIRDLSPSLSSSLRPREFENVTVLNLNGTGIRTFRTLRFLDRAMPSLRELCVAHSDLSDMSDSDAHSASHEDENDGDRDGLNQLQHEQERGSLRTAMQDSEKDVTPPALKGFENLTLLDCSDCNLSSWDGQVCHLRSLPKLETLILDENPLADFETPALLHPASESTSNKTKEESQNGKNDESKEFPSLTALQLANTAFRSWTVLDYLSRTVPTLRSIRFKNTPVTSAVGAGEARSTIIARMPRATNVNGSDVTDRERAEAERRYVSAVARELLLASTDDGPPGDDSSNAGVGGSGGEGDAEKHEILRSHPRFRTLMDKHREAMLSSNALGAASGSSIASHTVNVTIRSMAASSCAKEPLRKRLPGSMKVGRLKAMCSRAFGLDAEAQALHFRASESDPFPTELDDDQNSLSYYSVNDGAEILMNEIDLEAREREAALEAEEHARRVDEQERAARAMREVKGREVRERSEAAGRAALAAASGGPSS